MLLVLTCISELILNIPSLLIGMLTVFVESVVNFKEQGVLN